MSKEKVKMNKKKQHNKKKVKKRNKKNCCNCRNYAKCLLFNSSVDEDYAYPLYLEQEFNNAKTIEERVKILKEAMSYSLETPAFEQPKWNI